ncbi:putative transposase [Ruegeria marina]|uniref:Putative transposase n=1 Tax=Ruegeria marina TaxID=639004 RepID=A0A1G6VLU4_9RHOB|nr:putative transposase [Ruegeria marina]
MRKSRFTKAQIIEMIKEQDAGMPTDEVCRKQGVSQSTFYKLKSKYGGMEVSDAAKLKALKNEKAKLKRLQADTTLDNVVLNDLLVKSRRHRMSGTRQRSRRFGIIMSRSVEPADLSV